MINIQEIAKGLESSQYIRPRKVNVFICDLSGSMASVLSQLMKDILQRIDQLPKGDALILGAFSSAGWFRWFCARELTDRTDYEHCKAVVKEEFYARSLTCFSEILADTPKAIHPFLKTFPVVTFTFFSDGIPVVASLEKEDEAIDMATRELAPFITSGCVLRDRKSVV